MKRDETNFCLFKSYKLENYCLDQNHQFLFLKKHDSLMNSYRYRLIRKLDCKSIELSIDALWEFLQNNFESQ